MLLLRCKGTKTFPKSGAQNAKSHDCHRQYTTYGILLVQERALKLSALRFMMQCIALAHSLHSVALLSALRFSPRYSES